jgi:hypothetical protein
MNSADARAAGEQTTDHRVLDTKRREFIALVVGGGLLLAANVRRYILSRHYLGKGAN